METTLNKIETTLNKIETVQDIKDSYLIDADYRDWAQDASGYYTIIGYVNTNRVSIGIINAETADIVASLGGSLDNIDFIRRAVIDVLQVLSSAFSAEHASYIGGELLRVVYEKSNYIQG